MILTTEIIKGILIEIFTTENLSKIFDGFIAVNHKSFSVRTGEVFGFLGLNGADKITTIKMLTTPVITNGKFCNHR
jgi:ABC-type multidrug transport system ATPase subunit